MIKKSIRSWLIEATRKLRDTGISSGRLDAELILAHTLRKSRTYLHAHLDEPIPDRLYPILEARLSMRLERTPLAYIIGHKEFYGRQFRVTPATLIPRPETETLIELFLRYTANDLGSKQAVDVGTGSGCIGITIKLERPSLEILLVDIDNHALVVARQNAISLAADVITRRSNLLASVDHTVDYIVANLPYVDNEWQRSPETRYEPALALFAADNGLALIKKLIDQTRDHLAPRGLVFLEADPAQHETIVEYATSRGFECLEAVDYVVVLREL